LTFVLQRLRRFDVKFEREEGDQRQFPVSSFELLLCGDCLCVYRKQPQQWANRNADASVAVPHYLRVSCPCARQVPRLSRPVLEDSAGKAA
jgi:hypothetical protein